MALPTITEITEIFGMNNKYQVDTLKGLETKKTRTEPTFNNSDANKDGVCSFFVIYRFPTQHSRRRNKIK